MQQNIEGKHETNWNAECEMGMAEWRNGNGGMAEWPITIERVSKSIRM